MSHVSRSGFLQAGMSSCAMLMRYGYAYGYKYAWTRLWMPAVASGYMVACGCLWLLAVNWLPVVACGCLCLFGGSLVACGCLRLLGVIWLPVVVCGCLRLLGLVVACMDTDTRYKTQSYTCSHAGLSSVTLATSKGLSRGCGGAP